MKARNIPLLITLLLCLTSSYGQEDHSRSSQMYKKMTGSMMKGQYGLARKQVDTMYMLAVEDKDTFGLAGAIATMAGFEAYKDNVPVVDSLYKISARHYLSINDSVNTSFIYSEISGTQRKLGNIDSALYYARTGRRLLKDIDNQQAYLFNSNIISLAHESSGQADSAIYYQLDVIKRLEPTDSAKLCPAYTNLASSFEHIGEKDKQRDYLYKAYSYGKAKKLKVTRGKICYEIAMYEKGEGNLDTALHYAEESLKYFQQSINKQHLNHAYSALANIYLSKGDHKAALAYIDSISNIDAITNMEVKSALLLGKMNIYLKSSPEKIDQALITSTEKAVVDVDRLQAKAQFYRHMAEYYRYKSDYKEVDNYNRKLYTVKDSLNNADNRKIVNDLQEKYETEKKELAIENLELVNSRQRQRLLGGGIALGLISLLSFFLFRLYSKVNTQKETISKALSEKDLLLREIHHRVKNNLQLVSSLLTLQGRSIDDVTAQQAIQEGKTRVRSMALIHQDLYNKENLTDIGVKEYVEKLSQELTSTYNIRPDKVQLHLDVDEIDLDVDTMIPLGLIINELVTNSLKYAFPEDHSGNIFISLKERSGELKLAVKDDGIGYNADELKRSSFGSTLISALVEQLDGKMIVENDGGTRTEIVLEKTT